MGRCEWWHCLYNALWVFSLAQSCICLRCIVKNPNSREKKNKQIWITDKTPSYTHQSSLPRHLLLKAWLTAQVPGASHHRMLCVPTQSMSWGCTVLWRCLEQKRPKKWGVGSYCSCPFCSLESILGLRAKGGFVASLRPFFYCLPHLSPPLPTLLALFLSQGSRAFLIHIAHDKDG